MLKYNFTKNILGGFVFLTTAFVLLFSASLTCFVLDPAPPSCHYAHWAVLGTGIFCVIFLGYILIGLWTMSDI